MLQSRQFGSAPLAQRRCRPGIIVRATPTKLVQEDIAYVKKELRRLLDVLAKKYGPGAAILPGKYVEKEQIDRLLERLQQDDYRFHLRFDDPSFRSSKAGGPDNIPTSSSRPQVVDDNMLGAWRLVYASNGTAVTRTDIAQLLVQASKQLPSTGLFDISQELSTDPAGAIRSTNTAVFGLGPLGSWRIGVEGSWRNTGDGRTAWVAFDSFKMRPVDWMGVELPSWLPQMELGTGAAQKTERDGRSGAEWVTTFCDDELRVGRGKNSGNLFLFRKLKQ